ncbi:MAG: DUF1566 domain-containing protein [Saprospiraceae bacterium]|nr:DUF1566 domain-containing protein [Candidatus Vicinibacter affinis]
MKTSVFITLSIICSCFQFSSAQSFPAKFNYQVSIRHDNGDPISDRMVSFKIYILENRNDTLNAAYREEHKDVSTKFGTASFMIGDGTNLKNSLMAVPFHLKTFFIKVQIDQNNGTQYKDFVTTQLISVPYAMVASQLSQNNAKPGDVLKWNGTKWIPIPDTSSTGGGGSSLFGDVTGSVTNNKVEKIQNRTVASTLPTLGQVLKWNGLQWAPDSDDTVGGAINLNGDVTGSPTSNKVEKIQGTSISTQKPKKDQYLKFDGSQWIPVDLLALPSSQHYVGELFGGGIVFHVYKDNSGVEHGLIVCLDTKRARWSKITNVSIGSAANSTFKGTENTIAIASQTDNDDGAAFFANSAVDKGYTDWYLPALDELNLISQARFTLNKILESDTDPNTNGFGVNQFWTSTEAGSNNAWAYNFGEIAASAESKFSMYNYRIIRKF